MMKYISEWWCRHFHRSIFRPVGGRYRCSVCLRTWAVPWERGPLPAQRETYPQTVRVPRAA